MAEFKPAYDFLRKYEGYYVNNPADRGGETYAGISRKANPMWPGWVIVDSHKPLKHNQKILDIRLEPLIFEQAKAQYWEPFNYKAVKNQDVANALFDFGIWASGHDKTALKVLKNLTGKEFNRLNLEAVKVINDTAPEQFLPALFAERKNFYSRLVAQDEKQGQFLKGWLNRLNGLAAYVGLNVQNGEIVTKNASSAVILGILAAGIAAAYLIK